MGKDQRERAATSSDVARLAGVSRSAVSRTFTPGASVAPATRDRVLAAAHILKYRPNQIARSLITSRSNLVALAISHLDNQFYPPVVERFVEALGAIGYRLLLFITRGESSYEPLLDELLRYQVEGVVLASSGSAMLIDECRAAGLPIILFNNAGSDSKTPQVLGNNSEGASQVARFLLAGGHRRFAFLAGLPGVATSDQRGTAFAHTIVSAGHATPLVAASDFTYDSAYRATTALLAAGQAPDALFCANDHLALAALNAAAAVGRAPGHDISIVGFDDVEIAAWPMLGLTTYSQPMAEMVDTAVATLDALIRCTPVSATAHRVDGRLIVRSSARVPAAGTTMDADGARIWRTPDRIDTA